jgi:N-acetylmuramoyl-L-alanine amidase
MRYKVHVQDIGWSEWIEEGSFAGTTGRELRLEAIIIEGVDEYRVHVQDQGWGPWVKAGEIAGTVGQSLRIEAIEIKGQDVNYRVHVQYIGWMDWARDGEMAGTTGGSLRVEAIQIIQSADPLSVDDARAGANIAPDPAPVPEPTPATPAAAQPQKSGKVYLAVGHGISSDGSWDCGCVDGNYTEADLMLAIGKVAAARLRDLGFDVLTDADTDNDKNIAVCVPEANNWGADVYVSLHCDYNQAPSGTLPIVYPGSDDGIRLANCLIASAQARNGLGTRGIIQRDDWEVSDTNMTACIFETGSIREDIAKLTDAQTFGEIVAQGIYDWF